MGSSAKLAMIVIIMTLTVNIFFIGGLFFFMHMDYGTGIRYDIWTTRAKT